MQGVLLLNCVLTVRAGKAGTHRDQGWETFTEHYVLPTAHPSARRKPRLPFSGCRHFSQVNARLMAQRKKKIRW